MLVDERDPGTQPRVLFYLEHAIQDASLTRIGRAPGRLQADALRRARRRRQRRATCTTRPTSTTGRWPTDEPGVDAILARPECAWITRELEQKAQGYAIAHVVPEHLAEVRDAKLALIAKTEAAVKDRLTKEITYWDHRAEQLKLQEQAGKPNARLNSGEARKRADDLQARLQKRLEELKLEAQISPLPPVVLGGLLVVPAGLLARDDGTSRRRRRRRRSTRRPAPRGRAPIVMEIERGLGFEPTDREFEKLGYDIESRVPGTGKLRFIEVKGRVDRRRHDHRDQERDPLLAQQARRLHPRDRRVPRRRRATASTTCASPFQREPDFGVTSVNYDFAELLARAEEPS